MQMSSKRAVLDFLGQRQWRRVLDAPCGHGWLGEGLRGRYDAIDGMDLFCDAPEGYGAFWKQDLDRAFPSDVGAYDLICCCEGIEHVGNPLLLLREFHRVLKPGGQLLVSTPNVWFPQSRMQFFLRGFFPSFPSLADKVIPGTHMHIMPWSWPQLYVYFKLAGFGLPEILEEPLSRPKHLYECILGLPSKWHSASRLKRARTEEERAYWKQAASSASRLGRHLIVHARRAGEDPS